MIAYKRHAISELQFQIDLFESKIEKMNFNILGRRVQIIQKSGSVDS
jgi:hypothetical protein